MNEKSPQLKDGSEWIDHEDCIVGDSAGLQNLIKACEAALEKGEYYGNDLGDYVGVKKQENNWFKDLKDSSQTRFANFSLAIFLVAIFALILIGFITVIKWLF